jgi:hypothetical protein
MGPGQGYVFDTLGEPHGACILPGEDALEQLYGSLGRACEAIEAHDASALSEIASEAPPTLPEVTTEPIRKAWRGMTSLLQEAGSSPAGLCASGEGWSARASAAMDAVIRRSLEMRLVARLVA